MRHKTTTGKFFFWVVMILVLVSLTALSSIALAQEKLAETFTAEDGSFGFSYPTGWKVGVLNSGFTMVSSFAEATSVTFAGPTDAIMAGATSAEEAITNFAADKYTIDETAAVVIGGKTLLVAPLAAVSSQAQWVVGIPLADGSFAAALVIAPAGTVLTESPAAAILASVDVAAATSDSGGGSCTVSTDAADTAQLRVGPGTNRTVVAFLPANQDFNVLGEAKANDDSMWWKLDKAEAAPKSAAAEIWVAQDAVTASGNCANVGEAAAPAIVPITQPKPPTTDATTTTDQSAAAPVAPVTEAKGTGIWINFPDWNSQLPANIKAASASSAKFLVTVNPMLVTVETADYYKSNGELVQVQRNRADYAVTVTVRETGQVVGQQTFTGAEPPGFPSSMSMFRTLNGEPPKFEYVLPWLQGFGS